MGSLVIMIFLFLLAFLLIAGISTSMFIGIGYILSRVFPLSMFQGALLSIAASFVVVISITAIAICSQTARRPALDYMDDDLDEDMDDEFDDDGDDIEDLHSRHDIIENTLKIGRNMPCPCGSGLKYKRCCGKELTPNS